MNTSEKAQSESAEMQVQCKRNGRPQMQAGRRLGLSLDYWTERHLLTEEAELPASEDTIMATDKVGSKTNMKARTNDEGLNFSLTLECEHSSPAYYPPIRISNDWLSSSITKPKDPSLAAFEDPLDPDISVPHQSLTANQEVLDWLDPAPPLLTTVEPDPISSASDQALSSSQPQARFVAFLEPPVTLPLDLAAQLCASVDVDLSQEMAMLQHIPGWDSVALPSSSSENLTDPSNLNKGLFSDRQLHATQLVSPSPDTTSLPQDEQKTWTTNMYIPHTSRSVPAYTIKSLPFSHPRQIVEVLPLLRQYALLTHLLQRCFHSTEATEAPSARDNGLSNGSIDADMSSDDDEDAEDALLNDILADTGRSDIPRVLDVILHIPSQSHVNLHSSIQQRSNEHGNPSLTLTLAARNDTTFTATLEIGLNGDVTCTSLDEGSVVLSDEVDTEKRRQALAKGLAICEDLGMWAEWVRRRVLEME